MISVYLFILAIIFSVVKIVAQKIWGLFSILHVVLLYMVLFNIGFMGLLAFYAHTALADETAVKIGWATGSPFQFEVAINNLSYGVLGILAFFIRKSFLDATVIGYCILLLGAFFGHMVQYHHGDTAPYNYGIFVWFNDLFIPVIFIVLWIFSKIKGADSFENKS